MNKKQAIELLSQFGDMPKELQTDLMDYMKPSAARENTIVHYRRNICDQLYFIQSGMLCCYDIENEIRPGKKKEKEYCTWIYNENNIVTCVNSFATGLPSTELIKAVTDTCMLSIIKPQLEDLTIRHPSFAAIRIRLTETYHIHSRDFERMRKRPPEEFHAWLAEHFSYIINAPVGHLASFMGIDPSTYHRLKRDGKI